MVEAFDALHRGGVVFVELRPHLRRFRRLHLALVDKRLGKAIKTAIVGIPFDDQRPRRLRFRNHVEVVHQMEMRLRDVEIAGADQTAAQFAVVSGQVSLSANTSIAGQRIHELWFRAIRLRAPDFAHVNLAVERVNLDNRAGPKCERPW